MIGAKMENQKFEVYLEDGKFWFMKDENSDRPYQEEVDWSEIDKLANGFGFSVICKQGKQRKWRILACTARSMYPLLKLVELNLLDGKDVICQTPDVEVIFYKG